MRRAEAMVRELLQPERTYWMQFGEMVPQLHYHLVPRTAHVGEAYALASGEEAPLDGARLVAWLWEEHASLGYDERALEDFLRRARAWWGVG